MKVKMSLEGMGTIGTMPSFVFFSDGEYSDFEITYTDTMSVHVEGVAGTYIMYNTSFQLSEVDGEYRLKLSNETIELVFRLDSIMTSTRLYRWIRSNDRWVDVVKM